MSLIEWRHTLDTPDIVFFYEQEFYVLSNFSSFQVDWRRHRFQTAEHAYHWTRFDRVGANDYPHPCYWHRQMIVRSRSAHEAFTYAQSNITDQRPDWDDVKVGIMRQIIREKALQNPYVFKKLMESGERFLIENSWRDPFWGWGPERNGKNVLGTLWMQLRDEFRAELAAGS